MSMDQSYYEALQEANSKGAIWWAWGDGLYYLGLLGSIISFLTTVLVYRLGSMHVVGSDKWLIFLVLTIFLVATFIISIPIKRNSYVIGKRDGVDPDTYWQKQSGESI